MTLGNDNRTDGQTDRRTDRVRRITRPPPREEGRIITFSLFYQYRRLRGHVAAAALTLSISISPAADHTERH